MWCIEEGKGRGARGRLLWSDSCKFVFELGNAWDAESNFDK